MPTGRTTVAYAPALTPEEEAALAAEQAAAAPAPQPTMYQPSSPPPADAAPVAAPVDQTTMYQPSSPPPAAESYTSISPQVTDTSNPSVEPGYSAPPSERNDDAMAVNQAYQPAAPWTSISPQDSGNAARSAYPVSVSDFRDPLKTPEATMAQDTRYSPADPGRQNTQDLRSAFGDNLGRSLGLNPNDPNTDMANQLAGNFFADTGQALGTALRTTGKIAGKLVGGGASDVLRSAPAARDSINDMWHLAQDVTGPAGMLAPQVQSTFDPVKQAADNRAARMKAGKEKASDDLGSVLDRAKDAVPGAPIGSPSVDEILSFPLPTFGLDAPKPPDVSENPDASWALHPGLVAQGWGFEKGKEARDWLGGLINPEAAPVPYDPLSSAYVPRSPETASTLRNWEAAEPAGTSPYAIDKNGMVLGEQRLYRPPADARNLDPWNQLTPDQQWDKEVGAARNGIPYDLLRSEYDPESSAYVPQEPAFPATIADAGIMDRARAAASAAKDWAAGAALPDVNLPGSTTRPTMYQPDAPPLSLRERATGALDSVRSLIPDDVTLPAITLPSGGPPSGANPVPTLRDRITGLIPDSLPNVTLPARGSPAPTGGPGTGGRSSGATTAQDPLQAVFAGQDAATSAVRSATQPEGTSVAQEAGANWIKDANGAYVGLVDPVTGDFVMLPAGATNEEKQQIVNSILTAQGAAAPASSAPGPAAPATPATGTSTTGTASNTSTSTNTENGGGGGGTNYSEDNSSSKSSGKRTTYSDDDDDSAPLKMEDFIQDFDGDGTIGKRDRMQGKQAFEQAKMARSKKRRGKVGARKTTTGFPFDREPSPIRQKVLSSIAESQGKKV